MYATSTEDAVIDVDETAGTESPVVDLDRAVRLVEQLEQQVRDLKAVLGVAGLTAPLAESTYFRSGQASEAEGIEGIFDGEHMLDAAGKTYQVSANYASKSKLVEGDPLKLYITPEGKFYYKQLGPIERKSLAGVLRAEGSHYVVDGEDGKTYNILTASVTYYMSLFNVRPNDRVLIMVPADRPSQWAVIDNVL